MVLPQFSIVVIAVKSVYLYKKWRLPLRKKGIAYYLITIGHAGAVRTVHTVHGIRAVRPVGPERRVRGISSHVTNSVNRGISHA
jgi:hypothetical protein